MVAPVRRLLGVLALAVLSLLLSYAIVAVSPDRAGTGKPAASGAEALASPAH